MESRIDPTSQSIIYHLEDLSTSSSSDFVARLLDSWTFKKKKERSFKEVSSPNLRTFLDLWQDLDRIFEVMDEVENP